MHSALSRRENDMMPFAIRKKRALYRAMHRGTKEMDILLGRFALDAVAAMTEGELAEFELVLTFPDPEIDQWMRGGQAPSNVSDMLCRIKAFHEQAHS
jgi:antitoxin CptB